MNSNNKPGNFFRKSLMAISLSGALVIGVGVSGASASNGAQNSSDRSHEAHDEHETDHECIGHGDHEDRVGDGVGHTSHGNGFGYGHGEECDDEATHDDDDATDTPADADSPVDETVPASEETVPASDDASGPAVIVDNVERTVDLGVSDAPASDAPASTDETVLDAGVTPAITPQVTAVDPSTNLPTTDGADAPAIVETASSTVVGSLPMTGSSIALLALATSLAIGGLLVLIARRRREEAAA